MNFKKVLSIASVASLAVVGLVSCGKKEKTIDADGNYIGTVNASVTYKNIAYMTYGRGSNSANMDKSYTTVDGRTLTANKTISPIWQDIGANNNVKFADAALEGGSTAESMQAAITAGYKGYKNRKIDMLQVTTGNDFTDAVGAGGFVNLSNYMDKMPNLKKWLDAHPAMKNQLTLSKGTANEGIYYTPYFDGLDQMEKGFNMNVDIVKALLDEEAQQTDASKSFYNKGKAGFDTAAYPFATGKTTFAYSTPYLAAMDQDIAVAVKTDLTKDDSVATFKAGKVHVQFAAADNIINVQNALTEKTGASLTNALKNYIDTVYGQYIKGNAACTDESKAIWNSRSEIFTSTSACYNADELIALLRCVKANPVYLTGKADAVMVPVFPRTAEYNRASIFYEMTQIFGNRGTNGEKDRLFIDANGKVVDGRTQNYSLYTMGLMRELQVDQLFPTGDHWQRDGKSPKGDFRSNEMANGFGFMTYDYHNVAAYNKDKTGKGVCENMVGVLPPYALWGFTQENGSNTAKEGVKTVVGATDQGYSYTRFSEDDRSLKDGGWSIVAKAVKGNDAKLNKLLQIMDYLYTPEGSVLECFGYNAKASAETKAKAWNKRAATDTAAVSLLGQTTTDEYLAQDADGNWYVNLAKSFQDEQVAKTGGTWHNYMTMYWGSCLGVGNIRSNYLEGQLTGTRQTVASKRLANASVAGAFYLAKTSGSNFLTVVPTVCAFSPAQSAANTSGSQTLSDWWTIGKTKDLWTSQMLTVVYSGWSTLDKIKAPAGVIELFNNANESYLKNTAEVWGIGYDATDHYTFQPNYKDHTTPDDFWYVD